MTISPLLTARMEDQNICYVDDKIDESCPIRISVTMSDHSPNTVMLMQYVDFVHVLRLYFDKGCMRFRDMRAKEAFIKMIAYSKVSSSVMIVV